MNHRCRERDRIEELRSPIGQAAYAHYSQWMRVSKKSVPPPETFMESKFYSTFMKFAEYAIRTNINDTNKFIMFMVQHGKVSPTLWCRDNVYSLYLKWHNSTNPPSIQVIESLDFVLELVKEYNTTPQEFFKTIPFEDLILFIRRKKISPWFLLASRTFREYLMTCPAENKEKIENEIHIGSMVKLVQEDELMFKEISEVLDVSNF